MAGIQTRNVLAIIIFIDFQKIFDIICQFCKKTVPEFLVRVESPDVNIVLKINAIKKEFTAYNLSGKSPPLPEKKTINASQ